MGGWLNVALMLLWLLVAPSWSQVRYPLPVLWIMPHATRPGQNLTASVLPAVQQALQDLSSQPPPLKHYEIQFDVIESECDDAKGLKSFFDAMRGGPKYLMMFGGVCPSVSSVIAPSLQGWNLVQLSFAASVSGGADEGKYPNVFSTDPSDSISRAVVQILAQWGWSRVGLLSQDGQSFSEVTSDLTKQLRKANVELAITQRLSNSPCISLEKLKNNDVWIIIGLFDESLTSKVFCCAHILNMFGGRYQWIVPRGYKEGWREKINNSKCTPKRILTAMEGHIGVDIKPLGVRQIQGISGRTPQQYAELYNREVQRRGLVASKFHGFAYDGIWAMAKALSQVMESIRQKRKNAIHRNATISDKDVEQMLLRSLAQTNFEGVTGQVLFRNGQRLGVLQISQFQAGREVAVGQYDANTEVLNLVHNRIRFQGTGPAKDRTTLRQQTWQISRVLYGILSTVIALSILTAFTFLLFIIQNRNHRLMKTSGVFTECLVILGAVLSFTSLFMFGLDGSLVSDSTCHALCSIQTWLLSIGYTLAFGTLFVKIWRVYTHLETEDKVHQPGVMVGALLLADLAILTSWQISDPLTRIVSEYSLETDPAAENIVVRPFVEHCESSTTFWPGFIFGYKGAFMLFGCFLAWRIRNEEEEEAPSLKDVRFLGVSLGTASILGLLGVSGSLLTSRYPNLQLCLLSLVVLLSHACSLALLVLHKILQIRSIPDTTPSIQITRPQSDSREEDSDSVDSPDSPDRDQGLLEMRTMEYQHLRRRITQLDSELELTALQLLEYPIHSSPGDQDDYASLRSSRGFCKDTVEPAPVSSTFRAGSGWDRSLLRSLVELTTEAQCYEHRGPVSDINSPEHVRRRVSIQLPILHHAYMPGVGGVYGSCSSLKSQ